MIDERQSSQKDAVLRRQIRRVNYVLLLILAALIIGPIGATWWLSHQYPSVSTVDIANLRVAGDAVLCPGDPLVYQYEFHALGSGALVRDRTIWQMTPPRTVVFSDAQRFILTDAIDQSLTEAWHIPVVYINPATDLPEPLPPGEYGLRLAISSPSKSTIVDIEAVDFEVRAGCP